jgi:hypothetical protein
MAAANLEPASSVSSKQQIQTSPPVSEARYLVRFTRHGAESFGWEICRKADSIEALRSTLLFATRIEAILDCARAAATLNSPSVRSTVEGKVVTEISKPPRRADNPA